MTALGTVRRRLFGISSPEATTRRPGFAPDSWQRLGHVAETLVAGYHATLEDGSPAVLTPRLDAVDPDLRGFAYEGAGMGLAVLDLIAPWKRRLQEFVRGSGGPYVYLVYVGAGLALARLRRRPEKYLAGLDPLFGWAVVDGYGFHEGFFSPERHVVEKSLPNHLSPYGRRLFDQGLGRSIWFSGGAGAQRVARTVGEFPPERQADLWCGVAMASAYAGGADRAALELLRELGADFRPQLARGAATAAWGRQMAGFEAAHTTMACEVMCGGASSAAAARVLEDARQGLPNGAPQGLHEAWRRQVESMFATT